MKVCLKCGNEISTRDGENLCSDCETAEMSDMETRRKRNTKARRNRKAINDVMESLGLKRVRGAMGGVYYE